MTNKYYNKIFKLGIMTFIIGSRGSGKSYAKDQYCKSLDKPVRDIRRKYK